mgnify:CR=1 FL=1
MLEVATGGKVALAILATLASFAGIALGVLVYLQKRLKPVEPEILAEAWRYDSTIAAFVGGPGEQAFEAVATFDRTVIDGAVNGTGWLTIVSSWFSHLIDKYIVDGLVNFVGAVFEEGSFLFRRAQTGLIQNYVLVMLLGVFAFVSIYLFVR